ncbi:hypothetical protein DEDE109153_07085 [Deinococcus deserti]|uniref:Uncharacterized protein n=1 Tax=Deinococcus deserti (strain DSM 17065 / CIP 109153 / LMG 22923 / VCD115) TaxID=546414 RepID=C1CWQ3_DEIDV|nr:hypothetical protein [Deinococcus deserti]ACO46620.2 Hypothetical protein Deide_16485 [Deinococcus deserti VCD115]
MKRSTITLFLITVASSQATGTQAQKLSPLYDQYIQAAAQVQTRERAHEDLRLLTRSLGRSYNKAETASKAYVCAIYLEAYLKVHPTLAKADAGMSDFDGTYQELQEDCETWWHETSTDLADESNAARYMADISISDLIIEGGSKQKLAEQTRQVSMGHLGWPMLASTIQLELLLTRYPSYRNQRLELGSTPIGTGARVLADSQAALQTSMAGFARGAQQRRDTAAAEADKDTMSIVNRVLNAYTEMLTEYARAESLLKQKQFKEAGDSFYAVGNSPYTSHLGEQSKLLEKKIRKQVAVGGKTMSFDELVNVTFALAQNAKARGADTRDMENKELAQLRAAWRQAATSSLKGDKLKVYQQVGRPDSVIPQYQLSNSRIKESVAKMVSASAWHHYSWQTRSPQSFSCSVTYFFNGNKLTGARITADPAYIDFTRDCQNRYQLK